MSGLSTGDNEDGIVAEVFSKVRTINEAVPQIDLSQPDPTSPEVFPFGTPDSVRASTPDVEDHRSQADKALDGDYVPSDDEEQFGASSAKSLSSVINNSAKKSIAGLQKTNMGGQQESVKKPREKPMDLVGVRLATGKERNDRAAARNEMVERRYKRELDLKEEEIKLQAKKQRDEHETRMKELERKDRDNELRKAEIELRRLELQLEMEKMKRET
ncbi:hypothetical protein RvY_10583 [Ramazzottius varieornatus]|uniref:Uncharacterized protein n=1 Tax=Ramazzottius varieornatus TaxID=947166 RepID=A0A1D1VFB5_RAMVA|nr:hypothetical protein RvY_10583 [Ramazzottius varieornatus]